MIFFRLLQIIFLLLLLRKSGSRKILSIKPNYIPGCFITIFLSFSMSGSYYMSEALAADDISHNRDMYYQKDLRNMTAVEVS